MKRYSIAPSSSRRKSINASTSNEVDDRLTSAMELEKLEQQITLTLQQIDTNLSKSNAYINDKIFPILRKYSNASDKVWKNVNYWKYFFEQAANAEVATVEQEVPDELKTITKKNILLEDDDKQHDSVQHDEVHLPSQPSEKKDVTQFKRPLLKGNIEESTPTWSTDHPHGKKITSTPQLPNVKLASKFDSTDSISLPPPITSTKLKSPTRTEETINFGQRKSLDKYQNFSLSPKKTPVRIREVVKRRSTIQELIDSSPTWPQEPALESEKYSDGQYIESGQSATRPSGSSGSSGSNRSNIPSAPAMSLSNSDIDKAGELSPIILDSDGMQRFPRTPQHETFRHSNRGSRRTSYIKTPIEIRQQYQDDDSEIRPPELSVKINSRSETDKSPDANVNNNDDDDDDDDEDAPPFPDLDTMEIQKKSDQVKRRKIDTTKLNDKDNVFLDDKNTSVQSTLYHSIVNQEKSSRDNTDNRSYSNLFEDVLLNTKTNDNKIDKDDTSDNSSREMGSILQERFNQVIGK